MWIVLVDNVLKESTILSMSIGGEPRFLRTAPGEKSGAADGSESLEKTSAERFSIDSFSLPISPNDDPDALQPMLSRFEKQTCKTLVVGGDGLTLGTPEDKKKKYDEAHQKINKSIEEGGVAIICGFQRFSDFSDDRYIWGLLSNSRTGFLRLPFTSEGLAQKVEELKQRNSAVDPVKDWIADTVASTHKVGALLHALEDQKIGTDRAREAVSQVNELYQQTFDVEKQQLEARVLLQEMQKEIVAETKWDGVALPGVYCDVEGTLLDINSGAPNEDIIEKLKLYSKDRFVHVWTGGGPEVIKKAESELAKVGLQVPVLNKNDFRGARPELIIDDATPESIAEQYGIHPNKFESAL